MGTVSALRTNNGHCFVKFADVGCKYATRRRIASVVGVSFSYLEIVVYVLYTGTTVTNVHNQAQLNKISKY